jgi:8-oxo-dGTP pyrophosphatase MutT (NUDIX family)
MLPAMWCYIDQRFKSTQQAYRYVIMLEGSKDKSPPAIARQDGLTHAGGVVYRRHPEDVKVIQVMLVEASRDRTERVLPKGHIEPGEDPRETAVREVKEETGHWAKVKGWLDDKPLGPQPGAPFVRWFLLEVCEEPDQKKWRPEFRQYCWKSLPLPENAVTFDDTKTILALAAERLNPAKPDASSDEVTHRT